MLEIFSGRSSREVPPLKETPPPPRPATHSDMDVEVREREIADEEDVETALIPPPKSRGEEQDVNELSCILQTH